MVFKKKSLVKTIPEQELEVRGIEKKEEINFEEVWAVGNVPSQFEPAVINNETKEALTLIEALVLILNKLENIEEGLVGE